MNYSKVVFVNYFHNGDIYLSRNFVKYVASRFAVYGVKCHYLHVNSPTLLLDIPNVTFGYSGPLPKENVRSIVSHNVLILSTWYGVNNSDYISKYGITYNCLYHIFEDHIRAYLPPEELKLFHECNKNDFFPDVDYSHYQIDPIVQWLSTNNKKKILISNGSVLSGQAGNENLDPLINDLSNEFKNYTFILTNNSAIEKENVISSQKIIKKRDDLNEISYLSRFCDVIVGRCSGPYTFSMTKRNMFETNKTYIAFSNLGKNGSGALWYDDKDFVLNYSAKMVYEDTTNLNRMKDIISKEIRSL